MGNSTFSLEVSNGKELELLGHISNLTFTNKKERRKEHIDRSDGKNRVDLIYVTVNIDANFVFEEISNSHIWEEKQPKFHSISGISEVIIRDNNGNDLFVKNGNKIKVSGIFSRYSDIPVNPEDSSSWIGNDMILELTYSYTLFP